MEDGAEVKVSKGKKRRGVTNTRVGVKFRTNINPLFRSRQVRLNSEPDWAKVQPVAKEEESGDGAYKVSIVLDATAPDLAGKAVAAEVEVTTRDEDSGDVILTGRRT